MTEKGIFVEWEERLGIRRDDPNFEFFVRDALANKSEDEARATLILLGFVEAPAATTIKFDKDGIPLWLKKEK